MDIHELEIRNLEARRRVPEFRASAHPDRFGAIDAEFHRFKNRHPFHGFVPVAIGDARFVMFSANDDLVAMCCFWHGSGSFEPASLRLWRDMANGSALAFDVGAFTGIYSLLAAATDPKIEVDAFEPSRRTHGRLLMNVHANGFAARIRARNSAVGDEPKEMRLLQVRGEHVLGNGASLLDKGLPITDGAEAVEVVALDAFVTEGGRGPDLLKMDVEGAEILALEGMAETLSRHKPRMIVEVTPRTFGEVVSRLSRHGYRTRVIEEDSGRLLETANVSGVCNLLAE